MDHHTNPPQPIALHECHVGFWQKLGGTSLLIAVIIHVIAMVAGAIWIFQTINLPEKPDNPGNSGRSGSTGNKEAQKKKEQKDRIRINPATRVVASDTLAKFILPDLGDGFGKMAALEPLGRGSLPNGISGDGDGTEGIFRGNRPGPGSIGLVTDKTAKYFDSIPDVLGKRCSKEDRLQRLKENDGTPGCEEAVVKGLRWIKANQSPDGSFGNGNVAMTGLALLAYFGHCETPRSEEFGDSCQRAIVFLVNHGMKNDGRMANNYTANSWCYEHGIATYALGEAYTFCKDLKVEIPNLREVTEKAGQFIIDNQHDNGGWAYAYSLATKGAHTDLSIVGWQIQALKACSHTGIPYRGLRGAITKGLKYVESLQNPESGAFGYNRPPTGSAGSTLTGVGMLCFQMWDKGKTSPVTKGARSITKNLQFEYTGASGNLYQHYYESQAMMQRGGSDWKKYNDTFRDQVLQNQNSDGSWKSAGGKHAGATGAPIYNTCLCTLMLEVYYRFLNTHGEKTKRNSDF